MKATRWIFIAVALACGLVARSHAQPVNGIQAVVHDAVITRLEVDDLTGRFEQTLRRQYANRPDVFAGELGKVRNESMEKLIERQLILNDFKTSGLNLPESYIEEAIQEEIRADYENRANLTKTLQAQGMTYEKYRQQARERIIVSVLRSKNIVQETIVSPHKIEAYYKDHLSDYAIEEQVKLRMIVLNTASPAETETAKKIAEEITLKIKEGAPFAEMASTYSQGSQRNQGGDWGWVEQKALRKELRDVAFTLKSGEVSSVIETPEAIYLMFVEDKRTAHPRPINEVRDDIEKILLQQQQAQAQKRYIDKLKKKTFVRFF